jgi:O-antigen/teichoic acid export membrane protein
VAWLLVFGPAVLTAWVGPGFEEATPVLRVFAVVFLFAAVQAPSAVVLRGVGRVRAIAAVVAAEYVVNIALTLVLVPRVGIVGAALGTLVPITVTGLVLVPLLACRAVGVTYRTFLRRAVLVPALVGVVAVAALEAVRTVLDSPTWPAVIAGGVVAVALVGGLYLGAGATPREREVLAGVVAGTGRRLVHRVPPS